MLLPEPDSLFLAAGVGMIVHVACSGALSFMIDPDTPLFNQLFSFPLLGGLTAKPWLLRGRYFVPWIAQPDELREYWLLPRVLFLGARMGGMLIAIGFFGFLLSIF